jgi:hypothetical protein
MSYSVWKNEYQDDFCALGALEDVPSDEEILAGGSRSSGFPTGAYYQMRDDFPDNVRVPDNVYTMIHFVVSDRLRQALTPLLGPSRVEMLPVKIKDHQGRFVDGKFFVMNPLDVVDCIDTTASMAKFNALDPTEISRVKRLVLKPISEELTLFRPRHWTRLLFVRDDIAQKLEAAGLTGLSFREMDEFRG